MGMRQIELLMMRHGTTRWNQEKRYLGHTDISLEAEGREELLPLLQEMAGLSPVKVYCSDLIRCRESLEIVGSAFLHKAVYDPRLREMDFGEWEGRTYDELKDMKLYRQWLDSPQRVTPPRGESWDHFAARIADFMKDMLSGLDGSVPEENGQGEEDSPSILVVTHGGVIRQLAVMLVPGLSFWDVHPKPGSLLRLKLTCQNGNWSGSMLER